MTRPCPQCGNACDETHKFCPLCGFPISQLTGGAPVEDPFIHRTLPGGYVILDLVGIGGMGRVYRAEQRTLGRTVAVKVIHPHLLGDEQAAARFIAEARAASRLNHPHSVGVIDFGKTDDGQLYLVMEFLRGRDLATVSYEDGPLPIRRILDVLRQTLAALAEAHHFGIIHRDLKPENIILEPLRSGGDFVKVVDFGLAKIIEGPRPATAITSPGIICGTPDYMSPEQGRGSEIDARSDLYAIGVILFQMLTGRLPFEADTATQVVLMHLSIPAPDPRQVAPERNLPEELAAVVAKSLAKDPKDRWATADEMAEALAAVQDELEAKNRASQQGTCPSCGQSVPRGQKFCGECGTRISVPPLSRPPPSMDSRLPPEAIAKPASLPLPFLHRQEDLAFLQHQRTELRSSLTATRIVGEAGVGKTRLLREFLASARAAGDVVVETGPDPWRAEVSFYAVRRAIVALAALPASGGEEREWSGASAEARHGLVEVFGRADRLTSTLAPSERRYTVAEALRWALGRAANRAGKSRVIVAIDDLNRVDGASRNAFTDALGEPPLVPVLFVATHVPTFDPGWEGTSRPLAGLPKAAASELSRSYGLAERMSIWPGPITATPQAPVLPLYLDQLIRFISEGGSDPPARLADLIALRIERLAPATRRVLQALSVLGDDIDQANIERLLSDDDSSERGESPVALSISALVLAQIIERTPEGLRHTHPLVRDISGAAIPATVRRELHARAANDAELNNLPIEVRALHTLHAQDAFEALLLSEQVAERALARGDASGAVIWLHRGLELARRELVRGELDDPMKAVLIFSRKLGEALTVAGDLTDADGVLREALDLAGPSGADRVKVLRSLATLAHERDRSGEALGYLSEALELASHSGSHDLIASLEDMRRAWAS